MNNIAFAVRNGAVVATTFTGIAERQIPEGVFLLEDTIIMAHHLRVPIVWLADQLSRPELDGAVGPYVAELALLHGDNLEQIADVVERNNRVNAIQMGLHEFARHNGLDAARDSGSAAAPDPR